MYVVVCYSDAGIRREYLARDCRSESAACAQATAALRRDYGGRWYPSAVLPH